MKIYLYNGWEAVTRSPQFPLNLFSGPRSYSHIGWSYTSYAGAATICRRPLQVDLCPFDLDSGIRVTCDSWATAVPNLVFLGLSVLDLGPMFATDRQTSDRQTSDARQTYVRRASSLNAPYPRGRDIINSRVLSIDFLPIGPGP